MNEGDIYRWHWKGPYGQAKSYCCFAQIAVVFKGNLHDTYCGVLDKNAPLDLEEIEIKFQGNPDDMLKLMAGFEKFYRPEDIVDTRHPNNTRAPIYLKLGAQRDDAIMRTWIAAEFESNEAAIHRANNRIQGLQKALAQIEAGNLEAVYV